MEFTGIISRSDYPAINLATEEYLLKRRHENIFFLYADKPSIICGKHQNTLAETNFQVTQNLSLEVYRRLSGGGTVYHDEGNLNFCFISNESNQQMIDFKRYSMPILEVLNLMGVNATFGGRNDFLIEGKKISGNACHVFKNRVMHHGTLLFDSNLANLGNSLKTDPTKYTDKAVKSVRSVVTNISDHLTSPISFNEFKSAIFQHITKGKQMELTDEENHEIKLLADTKYSTWEWNYGYSPEYKFKKRLSFPSTGLIVQIEFGVQKGTITSMSVLANKETEQITTLFQRLVGQTHRLETIIALTGHELEKLTNQAAKDVALLLF